ncbi:binding-protein-dependent transport systems inner membrane component [Candidatus Vecturithrix granuli]|uniref:Binding-protein-dependent transport systems inner membrane component n=1 Tax=Vecturithrix granuli TaxID=1499967 RepID=A0A0S6W9N8_VECG1|nr:binding-protein-dependent transport systems inner membrane component [Candidatus Vecturithrix granuli]
MNKQLFLLFKILTLTLFLLVAVFPLYWIVVTSIKDATETYSFPVSYWPKQPTIQNYMYLFKSMNFGRYLLNSLMASLSAASVALLIASLSGYVMARKSFQGKGLVLFVLFFTQMIPGFMLMGSLYILIAPLRLVNSLGVIIMLYTNMMIPFAAIMMKGFFERIPPSLEDAALIDGCNQLQALFRIILPVTLPGLAATFSFAFVNCWNELFLAMMFLDRELKKTLPVGLNSFIAKADINWGAMSAGAVVALLPTILIFAFAQKYIVQGLTQGAVKG